MDLKYSYQLPYAFTEHGVAMLASVLRSKIAVKTSIFIIKTFVRLRQILSTHKELSHRFGQLEQRVEKHDNEIELIFEAIRKLLAPPKKKPIKIGFLSERK